MSDTADVGRTEYECSGCGRTFATEFDPLDCPFCDLGIPYSTDALDPGESDSD